MKKLLLVLLVLPLLFSCGGSLDKERSSEMSDEIPDDGGSLDKEVTDAMLDDGYTGKGTYTFGLGEWEGDKYVGEYKDGNFNGQGTYTYADGTIEKGLFENDEFLGE